MKQFLLISTFVIFLSGFCLSNGPLNKRNDSHWSCYLNNSLLIEGTIPEPDSIVLLNASKIKKEDLVMFNYSFDIKVGGDIVTKLFVVCPDNSKIQVSQDTSEQLAGHFYANRLKQIRDSLQCETLELQCFYDNEKDAWKMFKFKLNN